jgi:DNA (cytosine-5)-methyltransferase 1
MENNGRLKILSTFTGIGGFELGIEKALGKDNVDFVGFSEILPSAIAVYRYHWPEHTNRGDITKIDAATLPDFDLLVGGFPCQSFSCAGARRGFEDTRGTLFFDVARILKEKRPSMVLLENVKGLLYHDEGRTFKTILGALDELGYDVQWCVFNSKYFGVPQNRNRIYIAGHFRGKSIPKIYHSLKKLSEIEKEIGTRLCCDTLTATKSGQHGDIFIASTLTAEGAGHWAKTGSNVIEKENLFRTLTPMECERLQGFPDGWTEWGIASPKDLIPTGEFKINKAGQNAPHMVFAKGGEEYKLLDSHRYYLLGNAVSVPVVSYIIKQLYL